jgi:hypothetical protein
MACCALSHQFTGGKKDPGINANALITTKHTQNAPLSTPENLNIRQNHSPSLTEHPKSCKFKVSV